MSAAAMVPDQLDAIRKQFSACTVVVLVDYISGTVLYAAAAGRPPQERLDAYCAMAAEIFAGAASLAFAAAIDAPKPAKAHECIALGAAETLLLVNSRQDTGEALICVCTGDVDMNSLIVSAHRSLEQITSAQ